MSRTAAVCSGLVAAGVALRAGLLIAAPELRPIADEASYAYLALAWNRFGFLPDSVDSLWPPLYPGVLALSFQLFGASGLLAAKVVQVAASGVIGAGVALLSDRLFGARPAMLAAGLWALYLPLAAYTHLPRPETFFLALVVPAIVLLERALREPDDDPGSWLRLAAVGTLLGTALLLKQTALPVLIFAALFALGDRRQGVVQERLLRAAVLLLAAAAVNLPWTLRNVDVYDRVIIAAATLGRNLDHGLNGTYRNFDYEGQGFTLADLHGRYSTYYRNFIEPSPSRVWSASQAANVVDRGAANAERALQWAREDPGFFVRSRLKKLADVATPLSFFVGYAGRGVYDETPLRGPLRRAAVGLALLTTVVVLASAIPGLVIGVRDRRSLLLIAGLLLCFGATAPLVGMSRYRVPAEPLLIVLAAGWLGQRRYGPGEGWRRGLAIGGIAGLVALWAQNAREVAAVVRNALG